MKVKLFDHVDFDGMGCAILAKLAFKDDVNIEFCNNPSDTTKKVQEFIDSKDVENYDLIFITDLSIFDELAKEIDSKFTNFKLIDHHKTALNLNKYTWCKVEEYHDDLKEIKASGTSLFFSHLIYKDLINNDLRYYHVIEYFVEIVRKYDTWDWKALNDAVPKQWNDLLYILGREKFINEVISRITNNFCLRISPSDELLLELNQEKIDRYIEFKQEEIIRHKVCGYNAGVIFAEQYISELGNRLAENNPDLDFIVIINMSRAISYRTVKEVDLSEIAKIYGGGGHPKASGSLIDKEVRLKLVNSLFKVSLWCKFKNFFNIRK